MNKLRKHFSAQFCNLVAKSNTLVADIEKLRKWGFKILPGKVNCTGDADIDNKVIRIGHCKLICRIYILAHEIGHVLNSRDLKKVSAHRSSIEQYVFAEIRDEAKAIRYAMDRLREVYADRPREKHHFDAWTRSAKAGKWAQLLRDIRESLITTGKSVPFEEYWADSYKNAKRSAVRKRKKTLEQKKHK